MLPPNEILIPAMLAAYRRGFFPMADPDSGELGWYFPDPRALLPLRLETDNSDERLDDLPGRPAFHLAKSLRKRLRAAPFRVTSDRAFRRVIEACAEVRPGREDSWIDERIVEMYTRFHTAGHAHSIECWLPGDESGGVLVGGLYGVHLGGVFFAESKFSRPELGGTDASKIALAHLVAHLRQRGFRLLDVQIWNPHTARFGVVEIPAEEFLRRLGEAARNRVEWGPFLPDTHVWE